MISPEIHTHAAAVLQKSSRYLRYSRQSRSTSCGENIGTTQPFCINKTTKAYNHKLGMMSKKMGFKFGMYTRRKLAVWRLAIEHSYNKLVSLNTEIELTFNPVRTFFQRTHSLKPTPLQAF